MNWNSVNTTKIRTTLGKVKDSVDEPSLANGGRKEAEGYSDRDLGELILLLVSKAIYRYKFIDLYLSQLLQWHWKGLRGSAFAYLPWIHTMVLYLRTNQRSKNSTTQRSTTIIVCTFPLAKRSSPLPARLHAIPLKRRKTGESIDCVYGAWSSNA